ncbi:hypothetical protein Tel_12145 [Candidatus Tenderia electrophaga]|uniref:Uncharacterized protein n=1 Tax=Candidatus Tenderia electrophaga TaxID=1748243 RepID=A0A0S2TF89_9GAMM|nr:hypothetical protein Tel_12145 [Candidatus Tenderia electrophaga]
MLIERIEQRVLGALRLVDRATQTPLTRAMQIGSPSARLLRNRRGFYVITHADGLASHSEAFLAPPDAPALQANQYVFEIADPQRRYLPRLVTLRLPRDPDPDNAGHSDSLFTPRDVAMYPAATAVLSHNWSTVRASVTQGPDPATAPPVRGSLIRIINAEDDKVLASGISDERGEALVIVPGVPVTKFADADAGEGGDGDEEAPVLVNTLAVRLELSLAPSTSWPVDPDLLEQDHETHRRVSMDLELATGRMERVAINLT